MSHSRLSRIGSSLWRIKGSLLIQIVIISIGVQTRDFLFSDHEDVLSRFGFDYDLLLDGRLWHLLTGTWIQSSPGIAWSMVALVFGGTVFLELLAGTPAMLLTCVTGDWFATLMTTLTLRVLASFGDVSVHTLLSTPDAGTSALAHAGYGAAIMLLPRRWIKVALPALIVLTTIQFFLVTLAPAIVHCWAAIYGVCIGWFVLRPRREQALAAAGTATGKPYAELWDSGQG